MTKAEPVELSSPPGDDPCHAAAASLPATRAPHPAAQPPPMNALEQKFLTLLEVVEKQNSEIANMRADIQWYHSEWQNIANAHQASPTAPTTAAPTTPTTRALAPIDRKVIEKPYKYTGDIKVYIQWQTKLKDYLCIYDERWRQLLDAIEEEGSNPINEAKALETGLKIGISEHLEEFKR